MDSSTESEITEKLYYCIFKECKASFKKKRKLINHSRLHCGERPFACNIDDCTKSYTNSSHLARHKSTFHNKVKVKLPCTFEGCDLMLSDAYSLKRHIARHEPTTPQYAYNCDVCDRGFLRKKQLEHHTCSSSGLPFQCEFCGEGFSKLRNCNRHKRKHKVYTCECDMKFEQHSQLLAHRTNCDSLQRGFIE